MIWNWYRIFLWISVVLAFRNFFLFFIIFYGLYHNYYLVDCVHISRLLIKPLAHRPFCHLIFVISSHSLSHENLLELNRTYPSMLKYTNDPSSWLQCYNLQINPYSNFLKLFRNYPVDTCNLSQIVDDKQSENFVIFLICHANKSFIKFYIL